MRFRRLLLIVEVLMCLEREEDAREIGEDHRDRYDDAKIFDRAGIDSRRRLDEEGGDDQRHDGKEKRDRGREYAGAVEVLSLAAPAAEEHGHAADEKEVGDDRTGERCLDDADESRIEGEERDDEFCRIAERRIDESAERRRRVRGEVLSRFADVFRERDDGQGREEKDDDRRGMQVFCQEGERRERQEPEEDSIHAQKYTCFQGPVSCVDSDAMRDGLQPIGTENGLIRFEHKHITTSACDARVVF